MDQNISKDNYNADDGTAEASTPSINILTDPVSEFNCPKCDCLIDVSELPAFTEIECPNCESKEYVPAKLGNFLLLKLLGTGGMGGVYYAKDETLSRFVAIKVMLQKLGSNPEFIETFRREAQAVAKLNHPNISQIYSFGQEKGQPYIVMELITGEHVDEMMEEDGGISPPLAMRICYEVAQGLQAADDAGIVHGDIKPENILLDKSGRAKIVDFGLATVAHAAAEEGIWGTPYYISPEKIRRQKIDARADIYSLGATLYHILTGTPPFEGETPIDVVKARLTQPPPDIKKTCPDMPEIVAQIVTRMLATERTSRYPTYKSLISDMRKAVHELGDAPVKTGRLGGKQIKFKNKNNKLKMTGSNSGFSSSTGSIATKQKKIVIRKDKGRSAFKDQGIAKSKTFQKAEKRPAHPVAEVDPQKIENDRKKDRKALILILLFYFIIIGGGFGLNSIIQKKRVAHLERIELYKNNEAQKNAKKILEEIDDNVKSVAKLIPKTKTYEASIKEAVLLVTGSEFSLNTNKAIVAKEPLADTTKENLVNTSTKDVIESNKTTENTNTVDQIDKSTKKKATSKIQTSTKSNATEIATAVTQNISRVVNTIQPVSAETVTLLKPNDPILQISDIKNSALAPISVAAINTITNLRNLETIGQRLKELHKSAESDNKKSQETNKSKVSQKMVQDLENMSKNCDLYTTKAKKLYHTIRESYTKIAEMEKEYKIKVEKERKAQLEAEKLNEEQERKQREEAKLAALSEKEIKQAKLDHAEMNEMFRENNFDAIVKTLKLKKNSYQTEAGKNALQIYIDRYEYLVVMRDELIKCINNAPFKWGWGYGATARDITKASRRGLSIKDSTAVSPWKSVSIMQMLKLANYYTTDRKTPIPQKQKIAIGAAIFCDEFGEKARAKSKAFLNIALNSGFNKDKAKKLFKYDI